MTDNITPQGPQAKAPMTTDEIINRLGQVMFTSSQLTADTFSSKEVARDKQAMALAAQAVELLEEIKKELHDECCACAHHDCPACKNPCLDCIDDDGDHREFRWPLGEEADHENK
ncbi:MAG: hypothetical protein LIO95_10095 [Clostridiales bacterium]|nr:hypothetical protein [Clostridiales bacterium]